MLIYNLKKRTLLGSDIFLSANVPVILFNTINLMECEYCRNAFRSLTQIKLKQY